MYTHISSIALTIDFHFHQKKHHVTVARPSTRRRRRCSPSSFFTQYQNIIGLEPQRKTIT
ncbi:hypothetical protein HanXRQr2_Chr02g0085461 [Helianthus annuus]|uniref:Uncharacterized protein n=1 Tax=Helianthus annuus TaxID=4232 RepID=A0A9K3JRY1_HELAN|nr:hypothetical protein HanXRQr2_Chr02g0085461 [Helianthus annuus]KAJ0953331.1 hypothetical protein HanPSC8_Chr02g0082611 [Helianthus annuus]